MSKGSLTILLAASMISPLLCVQSRAATRKEVEQTQFAQRVKLGIARMGVGEDARVSVQLRDRTRVAGYISEINEDSFVVTSLETRATTTVAYPLVTKIKGQHITSGMKIAMQVIGVTLGILVLWAVFAGRGMD